MRMWLVYAGALTQAGTNVPVRDFLKRLLSCVAEGSQPAFTFSRFHRNSVHGSILCILLNNVNV